MNPELIDVYSEYQKPIEDDPEHPRMLTYCV